MTESKQDGSYTYPCNINDLEETVMKGDRVLAMPLDFYQQFERNKLLFFMHQKGLYTLPTTQLIDWLSSNIIGKAIEIACGNGAIGRALGIPLTDNRMQEWPQIQLLYLMQGQKTVTYPKDVEALEGMEAVIKYRPDTVIGSFVTEKFQPGISKQGNVFGVDEVLLLTKVRRYINIGNLNTHHGKPIYALKHASYNFDWLITRAKDQSLNRIFVWTSVTGSE